mgnify:FL=1
MKKYERIYDDFKAAIYNGEYKAGDKLPTEEQIAAKYGVSRVPVQQAMNALIGGKMVKRVIGSGTFVTFESHLAMTKNRNAVFLLNEIDPETAQIVEGAQRVLHKRGIFLSTRYSGEDFDRVEQEVLEQLKNDEIAGLMIYPIDSNKRIDLMYELVRDKKPLVFVDKLPNNLSANCVMSDPISAMDQMVGHLVEHGHRRIAFVGHDPVSRSSVGQRLRMAAIAMHSRGLELPQEYVRCTGNAYTDTLALLDLPHPPTAVVYCAAVSLYTSYQAYSRRGVRIPEDISVMAHDDITRYWDAVGRKISCVRQDYDGIGEAAAKRLYQYLVKPDGHNIVEYVPTAFADYGSVRTLNAE